jgi:DNA-binding FrmR family transcriptional regulator
MAEPRIVRPDPDPTERTIEQSLREISNIKAFLEGQIKALQELIEEKLRGVSTQFSMRDTALTAAFKAAQDAVTEQNKSSALAISKSEVATAESIKQLQILFQTTDKAANEKINDLKSRLDKGEGHTKGLGDGWGYLVGAIGLVWGIVATVELLTKH